MTENLIKQSQGAVEGDLKSGEKPQPSQTDSELYNQLFTKDFLSKINLKNSSQRRGSGH